jgi:hypothetical protein
MRRGIRVRGSKRRIRQIDWQHRGDLWRILLIVFLVEAAAVLTWALVMLSVRHGN